MSIRPQPITIIGAGLAGALAAVFLARRGFEVTVYERRPDMRKHRIPAGRSINLALADRGIHALEMAGVLPQIEPLLIPMKGRRLHDVNGNLSFQPYGKDESEVIYSVSRPGLNKVLMDVAEGAYGVRFHFDQRLSDVDFRGRTATLRHEGTGVEQTIEFGPAIAADGAGSVVRQAMVDLESFDATEDGLPHSYKELTIPGGPDGEHQLEKNALHIWPRGGYMLIALPNLDGSFTVTLFLPTGDFDELNTPERLHNFFSLNFPDTLEYIPELVQDFFDNPTGALVTVRCTPWHVDGTAVLIGDAAHAVVPFHGQGMNCAFEDCLALDQLVDHHDDWASLFADLQRVRKPNAEAIADMALENYIEMRDTVRDPKFQLQKTLSWALEVRFPRRFIPRYSMVMFHHEISYAEAKRRGSIQAEILEELTRDIEEIDAVDFNHAEMLIESRLDALPGLP